MFFNLIFYQPILLWFIAECILGMMPPSSSSQNQPLVQEAALAPTELSEEEKTFRKFMWNFSIADEELQQLEITSNEYPLSMQQVAVRKSVNLLEHRLQEDLKRTVPEYETETLKTHYENELAKKKADAERAAREAERYPSRQNAPSAPPLFEAVQAQRLSEKWAQKLGEMEDIILSYTKSAIRCHDQSKSFRKRTRDFALACNDRKAGGYLDKLYNDMRKKRISLLNEALRTAANLKGYGLNNIIGQVDVSDLIELALTITNTEKMAIGKDLSIIKLTEFLEKMQHKKEISENAALAYILGLFLKVNPEGKALRDTGFQIDEKTFQEDILTMKKFFNHPEANYANAGPILARRNYVHLRHLFHALLATDGDETDMEAESSDSEDEGQVQQNEGDQFSYIYSMPKLYKTIRNAHLSWTDWIRTNPIVHETVPEMRTLNDLAYLKLKEAEINKKKDIHLWKLLKAIVLDVEFGRPYFYAQLLNEKIQKLRVTNWAEKMFVIDYPDLFSDLTRIVLTRAPVDLADVALAYKSLYGIELVMDLGGIISGHYPFDASDGHQTLAKLVDFIKWALHEDRGPAAAPRIDIVE